MIREINLTLVESVKEIKFIQANKSQNLVWIPLNLETLIYLKKRGIEYINPILYLNNDFHKESLKESEKIKKIILEQFSESDMFKTRYIGIIRKYFFSIFFIIKILEKIKKKFQIKSIILSGWNNYDFYNQQNNFFVSKIISNIFGNKIKLTILSSIKNEFFINNLKYQLLKKLPNKYFVISNLGYNFKRLIISNLFTNKKILVFNFDKISSLKKFLFKILGVFIIEINRKKVIVNNNNKYNFKLPKILYKYKSYDLSSLLEERNKQIYTEISELIDLKNIVYKNFDLGKPDGFYLNMTRGLNSIFLEYSKQNGLPCYLIPHGTISLGRNIYEKIYNDIIAQELISDSAYNCIQTKIGEKFFSKKKNYKKCITGNLIFAKGNSNKFGDKILYAVTNKGFHNMLPYGIENFYEFYSNLEILNNICRKHNYKIIVRPHPGIKYLSNDLKKEFTYLLFSNDKLEKIFEQVFVTISFSSTIIEDSLCSKKPVILFDQWNRYKHCEAEEKPKSKGSAMYYVNNPKDLITSFQTIKDTFNQINFDKYLYKQKFNNNNFKKIIS